MIDFFSSDWFPKIADGFFWFVLALTFFSYISGIKKGILYFKNIFLAVFIFRILYSTALSIGQYYTWAGNEFTRFFLKAPLAEEAGLIGKLFGFFFGQDLGYFAFYVAGRFWFEFVLAILISIIFFFLLTSFKRHNPRFFEEGEVELGTLLAFLVGWPGVVLFIAFSFVFVLVVSIFRLVFLRERLTTLGFPFLFSALVVIWQGGQLIDLFELSVLVV